MSWLIPDFIENFWRPLYSNVGLRNKLKEMLGDSKLSDVKNNHLMVMSCDITDKDHPAGWCFTNVNKPIVGMTDKEIAKKHDFMEFNNAVTLVDVAVCTSAAPTYFEAN